MTHICVSEIVIIGSDNGLSPDRRQAIIWTNAGILLIGPLGINFNEILIEINIFSLKKMHVKMSSAKWRLFRLGLNVLNCGGGSCGGSSLLNVFCDISTTLKWDILLSIRAKCPRGAAPEVHCNGIVDSLSWKVTSRKDTKKKYQNPAFLFLPQT